MVGVEKLKSVVTMITKLQYNCISNIYLIGIEYGIFKFARKYSNKYSN
jgi:hypothetical protein